MLENIERLKIFYYIYSHNSFKRASELLYITQSAVSQSIKKLEEELNTSLFIRFHKRVEPTLAADELFTIVEPFLLSLDSFILKIKNSNNNPCGNLRLGAPQEFGKSYITEIISKFRQKYPDVTFNIKFGYQDELIPLLLKGKIDFIFIDEFILQKKLNDTANFQTSEITSEKMILACSKDYFKDILNENISFKNLSSKNFISYTPDKFIIKKWFVHHYKKSPNVIKTVLIVNNHDAVVHSLTRGIGLGIVASHLIENQLKSGELIHIQTNKKDIINNITLVNLENKHLTTTEQVFKNFVLDMK